jgi:chromosome segregation ATPase
VYMFLYESIEVSLFTSFLYQVIFLLPELTLSSFSA